MAKGKSFEVKNLLKSLDDKQLGTLHFFRGNEHFKEFVSVLNHIIILEKDKSVGLFSDVNDVDQAVKITSKGNFYRGRIKSIVLIHSLMQNAESELELREMKKLDRVFLYVMVTLISLGAILLVLKLSWPTVFTTIPI